MNKKMPKKYYLLSFGIGFWLTGLFLLSNLWHTLRDNKAVPKVVIILVKFIEQSSGVPILLFFVGSILVFIFLFFYIYLLKKTLSIIHIRDCHFCRS